MIALEITWHGLKGLRGTFQRAVEKLRHTHERDARTIAGMYVEAAKQWAPMGKYFDREGNPIEPGHQRLRDSIRVGSSVTLSGRFGIPGGISVPVQMAPHGKFTLEPTAPHVIPTWRTATKMLAFYWVDAPPEVAVKWGRGPIGKGVWVILPGVLHPGYKPTVRWDRKAWEQVEPRVAEMLGKSIGEWGMTIKAASDSAAEITFKT